MTLSIFITSLVLLMAPSSADLSNLDLGSAPSIQALGHPTAQPEDNQPQSAQNTDVAGAACPEPQLAIALPSWAWETSLTSCERWQGRTQILPGVYLEQIDYGLAMTVERPGDESAPQVEIDPHLHLVFRVNPETSDAAVPSALGD